MQMSEPWLNGQFLIAMPGMQDRRFERSVIYMCAHSNDGAMGIMLNRKQDLIFPDLLVQLGLIQPDDAILLPERARSMAVRNGGPVERSRGFVLHSGDYNADSSLHVAPGISLTATVDVLRAISKGAGPSQAVMALGYAGWAPGQLEAEISANGWLTCEAASDLVFEEDVDQLYARAMGSLGIDPRMLSGDAGHA